MVKHCIHPRCSSQLSRLHHGELYALESRTGDTRFLWLCAGCAAHRSVALDAAGNVLLEPRTAPRRPQPPHPDRCLSRIFMRRPPIAFPRTQPSATPALPALPYPSREAA